MNDQSPRKPWKTYFLGWVACLVVVALVYHYWPTGKQDRVVTAGAETGTPLPAHAKTSTAKHEPRKGDGAVQSADSLDAKSAAIAALLNANPQSWNEAQRNYLSRLDLVDAWDVLMAPGIVDQMPSKSLRESLLLGCSGYIQFPAQFAEQKGDVSLLKAQCAKLLARGDKQYFASQTLGLASDPVFNAIESRASGPDYRHLAGDDYTKQQATELSRATQNSDPWLAASGVRALFWMHSPLLSDDWSQFNSFNEYSQNRLTQTLATDVACRMTSYCGPNSPWTIQYCTLLTGTQCPVGLSYEDIVRLNMSQAELDLRQRILDNLSQLTAR